MKKLLVFVFMSLALALAASGGNGRAEAGTQVAEEKTPVEDIPEYFYFFRYLPLVASQTTDVADFLDVYRINSLIPDRVGLRSPFAEADIRADDMPGEPRVVVWTFPMPERVPMCRYMVFLPDGDGHCKVLTLEKSFEDSWIVGTMTEESHTNFGGIKYPDDGAAFVKVLREAKLIK